MAEFLSSSKHITARIEEAVSRAKEFVYFLTPTLSRIPEGLSSGLAEASRRGAKLVLIYREALLTDEKEIQLLQASRINIFQSTNLNTSVCLTEKASIISALSLFAPSFEDGVEFGTSFQKTYAAEMHNQLLEEFRRIWGDCVKMVLDDGKLITQAEWSARMPKEPEVIRPSADPVVMSTKKLTVKEKQEVIVKIFSREYQTCVLKVEDAERLRITGRGMVLNLSSERVDLIFIHYETFKTRLEEVQAFIMSRHPNVKFWFQYNRINMQLQFEKEIAEVFVTVGDAVSEFKLA